MSHNATLEALSPEVSARILAHMNEGHADSVLAYARHFGKRSAATAATLAGIDAQGMDLVVTEASGESSLRIPFAKPLGSSADARDILIDMSKEAIVALAASGNTGADAAIPERILDAVNHLRTQAKTLQLATISPDGLLDCSVAPFVLSPDGSLHVYISDMSRHTDNLRQTPRASALIIEDEATAAQILARRRLTLSCSAEFISGDRGDAFETPMQALREKFGKIIAQLEAMNDFHLVRLAPTYVRLVAGFGRAYEADPKDWTRLRHINDQGHKRGAKAS